MADSHPPELIDLPDLPLQIIAEHAGFRGVVNMQKVCSRFRKLYELHPPSTDFCNLSIDGSADDINITYSTQSDHIRVIYKNTPNGCLVSDKRLFRSPEDINYNEIANEDCMELFWKDLEKNLRLQTIPIKQLMIRVGGSVLRKTSSVLRARAQPLKVKVISIRSMDAEELELILQNLCPDVLKRIVLWSWYDETLSTAEIGQLANLEQWKSAEAIWIPDSKISVDALHHFLHLSTLSILVEELRMQPLVKLKEMILSPNFKSLHLNYETDSKVVEIETMLGIRRMIYETSWYFKSPHENVWIRVTRDKRTMDIEAIGHDEIPHGAIVQPMFQIPDD